ncbi:MAG: DNA-binding protein HU [Candidatus Moranbacteria bacterium GW2011_GWE1_36_7]|nr:MAG: DNA-binding protein HU [Candidatus Moranbacteria bacterium GW2011_GWE1_36_7]
MPCSVEILLKISTLCITRICFIWAKNSTMVGVRIKFKIERMVNTMANVNKDALVDSIATKTDLSKKAVESVIEALQEKITDEIRQGNKVTLTGFGTFKVSQRAAREGINPQTKAKIQIPAMTVPKFTAGKALKEAVK